MNSMVPNGIQTKHNNKMIAKKTSAKKEDVPVFLMKVSVRFLCVLFGSGCVADTCSVWVVGGMWDRVWPAAGAVPPAHSNAPIHQLFPCLRILFCARWFKGGRRRSPPFHSSCRAKARAAHDLTSIIFPVLHVECCSFAAHTHTPSFAISSPHSFLIDVPHDQFVQQRNCYMVSFITLLLFI